MHGEYNVPTPLKDEDKYLHMTKRQLIYAVLALLLAWGLISLFSSIGLFPLGLALGFIGIIIIFIIAFMVMPADKYLLGGGQKVETILLRLLIKTGKRIIFVKNYEE